MKEDRQYLECAMEEAKKAYEETTYPVGAVIVDPYGKIIGRGRNHVYSKGDFTRHAEMEAIRDAGELLMQKPNLNACTLYTTMEPCLMCSGAILLAGIKRVIWVLDSDDCHGVLRHLTSKPDLLCEDYYQRKIEAIQVFSIGEGNIADNEDYEFQQKVAEWMEQMAEWMKAWSRKKERRVTEWKEMPIGKEEKKERVKLLA